MSDDVLTQLVAGQPIVYAGNRVATVSADLAVAFQPGDHVVVDVTSGELLHIPAAEHAVATAAVDAAVAAFNGLADCTDEQISDFFTHFANLLDDSRAAEAIVAANAADVAAARARGRSTTRLELTDAMRAAMAAGLRGWVQSPLRRDAEVTTITHTRWSLQSRRAPLGVVGFVFEGRPNVFADATGVIRTGNTVVFRIGSDALGTARAIVTNALAPALAAAGLPVGVVQLVDSPAHAAGWALFADRRLSLAVARGSGKAVAQLASVARQAGVPVSVHGTGGAWMAVGATPDRERLRAAVVHSLDRKVCNTLNVCCVVASRAGELVPAVIDAVSEAARRLGADGRVHVTAAAAAHVPAHVWPARSAVSRADGVSDEPFISEISDDQLAREWEWEGSPEITLHVVADLDAAIAACNAHSPRFVASLLSDSAAEHERFYAMVDAPFVGDGFTRWVDGQYALDTPELGLSNWEGGRLLGRGGILSGDGVHTVRYRAHIVDPELHR